MFCNTSNGPQSFPYLVPSFSSVVVPGDATFSNNALTPIVAYSSTITLSGNISFLSNSGNKGGAIALYPSTLNIASNTSIYFYYNSARETGGAIQATTVHKYSLGCCFYRLLNYSSKFNWYDIFFVNNLATNGGDHIILYGEFMHSGACFASSSDRNGNRKMPPECVYVIMWVDHNVLLWTEFMDTVS